MVILCRTCSELIVISELADIPAHSEAFGGVHMPTSSSSLTKLVHKSTVLKHAQNVPGTSNAA